VKAVVVIEGGKVVLKKATANPGMVDVGGKPVTRRTASAVATISLGKKIFQEFQKNGSPKGDVLKTAELAGILAAKATPQAIPMCHVLLLNQVTIHFDIDIKAFKIDITAMVRCDGRTGVEMEALHAASVAALTIYDMLKCYGQEMTIDDIKLIEKTGGKSGAYWKKDNNL
jgi:cyclic pyranopterin monophosphate synthase